MEKLEEITNCQKPEHFYKLKNPPGRKYLSRERGLRYPQHTHTHVCVCVCVCVCIYIYIYTHVYVYYVNPVPTKSDEATTNYRGPTVLHMFLSFSAVSIFVDLQINPFRPSPSHSATESFFPIWCKNCKPVHPTWAPLKTLSLGPEPAFSTPA